VLGHALKPPEIGRKSYLKLEHINYMKLPGRTVTFQELKNYFCHPFSWLIWQNAYFKDIPHCGFTVFLWLTFCWYNKIQSHFFIILWQHVCRIEFWNHKTQQIPKPAYTSIAPQGLVNENKKSFNCKLFCHKGPVKHNYSVGNFITCQIHIYYWHESKS